MRITRLELKAFGPFTDRVLTFAAKDPGLHILFGANEAGKSSSLRALKALLFGFPERTPDNFLHASDQLLVSGCLQAEDGRELAFMRRKKRKADLLDLSGNALDPSILASFLNNIDPGLFAALYGIDHEALIRGGEDILAQKGEVGQALFAAGAGISSLQKILSSLDDEADSLFRARGTKQEINVALARHRDLHKELKATSLSSREWRELQTARDDLEQTLLQVEAERNLKDRTRRQKERLRHAMPYLGQRRTLKTQIDGLGQFFLAPEDVYTRWQGLDQEARAMRTQLERAGLRLTELEALASALPAQQPVLGEAEAIEDLLQKLGAFRKGMQDRLGLEGQRNSLRAEAALLLGQVRPDLALAEVDLLRPVLAKRRVIQQMAGQYEALQQRMSMAGQQGLEAKQQQKTLDEARRGCLIDLHRLSLWQGELSRAVMLPLPLPETVRGFVSAWEELLEQGRAVKQERDEIQKGREEAFAALQKIVSSGEVPTETELFSVRERRDQGWRLLRRQWLEHADVAVEARAYDPGLDLPDAYEKSVGHADVVADRLRRDADRVALFAARQADLERLDNTLGKVEGKAGEQEQAMDKLLGQWQALWQPCGIEPLSPKEMLYWQNSFEQLRFRIDELHRKEREVQAKENRAAEELSAAEEALGQWQRQWHIALTGLGLDREILPIEVPDLLDTLESCFSKIKEAEDLRMRIEGIDRDAAQLADAVQAMLVRVGLDGLAGQPLDQSLIMLQGLLTRARQDRTLQERYDKEEKDLRQEIRLAEATLGRLNDRMNSLLAQAQCAFPEELAETVAKGKELRGMQERLRETEETLARIGEGTSITELERVAEAVDNDALPGEIDSLAREIKEELDPGIKRLSQKIGEHSAELQRMDGSAKAARIAEALAQVLARIRRLSEQYVRLKLAAKILREEIEHYRAVHQDPILQLASGFFSQLTLGSLTELRTDVDDQGQPILVGVRPDRARVTVAGMSSGTRDQLYLSLRLATLAWRLRTNEPLPFIVDDILINFDDDRSRATLKVLADLAASNQVLLFTHHRQIVNEARAIEGLGSVHIYEL